MVQIMTNCARVCKGMCKGVQCLKALYLLACAGCARVTRARIRVNIKYFLHSDEMHVRTRATPAHPAHLTHALFYAGLRVMHPCTYPYTPLHI